MNRLVLIIILLVPLLSSAQQTLDGHDSSTTEQGSVEVEVGNMPDQMPSYPGGEPALYLFILDQLEYPEEALKKGIEGKVFVGFRVEASGALSNFKIRRGISTGCDEEALRILSLMPDWEPATMRGKPVAQEMMFPIHFVLPSEINEKP